MVTTIPSLLTSLLEAALNIFVSDVLDQLMAGDAHEEYCTAGGKLKAPARCGHMFYLCSGAFWDYNCCEVVSLLLFVKPAFRPI